MTSELLSKGIDALKDINNIIMKISERDENNNHDVVQIQNNLNILTDVLHQAFIDMVSVDDMREKIRIINETLEEHLSKFQ